MLFRLKRGEVIGDGLRRLTLGALRAAAKNLELPPARRDEGIHEARKDLKKARAILRLQARIPDRRQKTRVLKELRRLRAAARRLSAFRDAAVAIETLDALCARHARGKPGAGAALLRARLVERKAEAEGKGLAEALEKTAATVEKVERRIRDWKAPSQSAEVFRDCLEAAWVRACRAHQAARGNYAGAAGHVLRMRVKDLWYVIRVFEGRLKCGSLEQRLNELETLLGDDHNLAMLSAAVGPKQVGGRTLVRWIATSRVRLCKKAEAIGSEMFAEKARAFSLRVWPLEKAAARP